MIKIENRVQKYIVWTIIVKLKVHIVFLECSKYVWEYHSNQINLSQMITNLFVYIGIHTMPKAPSPNFSKSLNWCLGNSGTFGKLVHNSSNCELTGMCNVVNSSPPLLLDALWKCCCCCQGCCCKGQLISEWLFDVLNFPKNQHKNLMNFCPRI